VDVGLAIIQMRKCQLTTIFTGILDNPILKLKFVLQSGSDGQIIVKWIIKKWDGKAWQAVVNMKRNVREIS
jgi:hypothetical protein